MNKEAPYRTLVVAAIMTAWLTTPALPQDQSSLTSRGNLSAIFKVWMDPDGRPLPFKTEEEILEFLRTAQVIARERTPIGITEPWKVLLEKDGIRAHGTFRTVDIFEREWRGRRGMVRRNFRDSFRYECAAYQLSKMLNLHRVPPAVLREVDGEEGSLQLWVEDAFTDQHRIEQNLIPPNLWRWNMQNQMLKLFDNLVFNDDRNQGNILIDSDWKIWWIDHTRTFRVFDQLPYPETIEFCERSLWERLQSLEDEEIADRLEPFLSTWEISTLLKRRKALVKLIEEKIDQLGERRVLFRYY